MFTSSHTHTHLEGDFLQTLGTADVEAIDLDSQVHLPQGSLLASIELLSLVHIVPTCQTPVHCVCVCAWHTVLMHMFVSTLM